MSENSTPIITVKNLDKSFLLPHDSASGIKQAVVGMFSRNRGAEKQVALKNVSFTVNKGEFFGIVGRNGSGKSTLLKLLAGIYVPDSGLVQVSGNLTPFIELGVGFNMELTGRENVFLNGALLGFSRPEMAAMYDDIVEFAELKKFMDQKLKNYSSGMQVRLAFSIAIRAKSDILLVDEVLAVGDTAFQKKCYETFLNLKKEGRTIVFITHDMAAVERFCDRAMVIHNSKNMGIFSPADAAVEYDKLNSSGDPQPGSGRRWGTGEVKIKDVGFEGAATQDGKVTAQTGKPFTIDVTLTKKTAKPLLVGLAIEDIYGVTVAGPNSLGVKLENTNQISYTIPKLSLLPGDYRLTVALFDEDRINEYDHLEKAFGFSVIADKHDQHGKVELFGKWSDA